VTSNSVSGSLPWPCRLGQPVDWKLNLPAALRRYRLGLSRYNAHGANRGVRISQSRRVRARFNLPLYTRKDRMHAWTGNSLATPKTSIKKNAKIDLIFAGLSSIEMKPVCV